MVSRASVESNKHLIAVLGMHRSGTSTMARALMVLGVELGNNLMPALAGNNSKGFWEDMDVARFNEDLLSHLGAKWDSLNPIFGDRLSEESVNRFRQRALELLQKKMLDIDWFGMKDPRVARLLPFWKGVFSDLGLDVRYVLVIRNPLGVAASLANRDGFAKEKSLYLWLQHTIASVLETTGLPRAVLDFDRLMAAPRGELSRVASDLGIIDRIVEPELVAFCSDFLEDSLRHTQFDLQDLVDDPAVPWLATELFEVLTRVSGGELSIDSTAVTAVLQQVSNEMDRLSPALRFMAEADAAASRLRADVAQSQVQIAAFRQDLVACDGQLDRLSQALVARDGQLDMLDQLLDAREKEVELLRHSLAEGEGRIAVLSAAAAERDAMAASTSWRITRPLRLAVGVVRGEPAYRSRLQGVFGRIGDTAEESPPNSASVPLSNTHSRLAPSGQEILASSWPDLAPLVTYPDPAPVAAGRLTVMTDAFGAENLFAGDCASILFAIALARHRGLRLRLVTRNAPPEPAHFGAVLAAHGIAYTENLEFEYAPAQVDARGLAVADNDLVLTTSYATTWAALKNFDPSHVIYLVQDDERLYHPAGDQQIRCREALCDHRLRFIVSTPALYNSLVSAGMAGVAANGLAFELAFPSTLYYREPKPAARKRRFVFYARPHQPQDLFLRGLEAVVGAMESGFLPPEQWDLHFVGEDLPKIELPGGLRPGVSDRLPLSMYGQLIRQVDVGLSLTSTPRPSYPSLALAASGAVVVTNRYGLKQSLVDYCANILCVDPSLEDLVMALGNATQLAVDEPKRQSNYANARIQRDWDAAFAPVLNALAR